MIEARYYRGGQAAEIQVAGESLPVQVHVWMPDGILTRIPESGRYLVSLGTFRELRLIDDRCIGAPTDAEGAE